MMINLETDSVRVPVTAAKLGGHMILLADKKLFKGHYPKKLWEISCASVLSVSILLTRTSCFRFYVS